jgi:hypothetical protein
MERSVDARVGRISDQDASCMLEGCAEQTSRSSLRDESLRREIPQQFRIAPFINQKSAGPLCFCPLVFKTFGDAIEIGLRKGAMISRIAESSLPQCAKELQ